MLEENVIYTDLAPARLLFPEKFYINNNTIYFNEAALNYIESILPLYTAKQFAKGVLTSATIIEEICYYVYLYKDSGEYYVKIIKENGDFVQKCSFYPTL